jgi:hypothetical protein
MKKYLVLITLVAGLISCKNDKEPAEPVMPDEVPVETPVTQECFEGVTKNDTIRLVVRMKGEAFVDGTLAYHFYEKDSSDGTLAGEIVGDTLYADYTFQSEGKMSVREVVFLRNGKIFTEGYGDLLPDSTSAGKVRFKDRKKLYFDSKFVLMKVDCSRGQKGQK